MENTLTVTFDGTVLKPEKPLNLQLNKRYVITILSEESGNVWDLLENLAGTVDAPEDWAEEHDHYLYGKQITLTGASFRHNVRINRHRSTAERIGKMSG